MKLFISWSGPVSRRVAELLREWLPNVLQAVEPWMSAEDIEKGTRWNSDIAAELSKMEAGILCVTPDNVDAPWLNFEAGALSRSLDKTYVSPYLIGLKPADLTGPLVQFQATESTKSDTRRLIGTLNKALGQSALSDKQLDKTFDIWWPELESGLGQVPSTKPTSGVPLRDEREILEEILALVRDQAMRRAGEVLLTTAPQPLGRNSYVYRASWYPGLSIMPDALYLNPETGKVICTEAKVESKPADASDAAEEESRDEEPGRDARTEAKKKT